MSPLLHVLGAVRTDLGGREKHRRAVRPLMTQDGANAFSALSSDILVTDYVPRGQRPRETRKQMVRAPEFTADRGQLEADVSKSCL